MEKIEAMILNLNKPSLNKYIKPVDEVIDIQDTSDFIQKIRYDFIKNNKKALSEKEMEEKRYQTYKSLMKLEKEPEKKPEKKPETELINFNEKSRKNLKISEAENIHKKALQDMKDLEEKNRRREDEEEFHSFTNEEPIYPKSKFENLFEEQKKKTQIYF